MAIQPHPTIPDTVLLNVVDVFKSIDGGMSWTSISTPAGGINVHNDAHSIVWHPTDPNRIYVSCDGGIFSHSRPRCNVAGEESRHRLAAVL
jgi:hypothetical protein